MTPCRSRHIALSTQAFTLQATHTPHQRKSVSRHQGSIFTFTKLYSVLWTEGHQEQTLEPVGLVSRWLKDFWWLQPVNLHRDIWIGHGNTYFVHGSFAICCEVHQKHYYTARVTLLRYHLVQIVSVWQHLLPVCDSTLLLHQHVFFFAAGSVLV